jgi:hypothetical protein
VQHGRRQRSAPDASTPDASASDAPENDASVDAGGRSTIILPRPSLDGLRSYVSDGGDAGTTFALAGDELVVSGPLYGYLATLTDSTNLTLSFEWKWSQLGNSGMFLHLSGPDRIWPRTVEVQLLPGNAGDLLALDGTEMRETPSGPLVVHKPRVAGTELAAGEWNTGLVEIASGRIRFTMNGALANEAQLDPTAHGAIAFESEGGEIHFRNVTLRER